MKRRTRPLTLRVTLTEQQLRDSIMALPSFDVRGHTLDERRGDALARLRGTQRRHEEATDELKAERGALETARAETRRRRDELDAEYDRVFEIRARHV